MEENIVSSKIFFEWENEKKNKKIQTDYLRASCVSSIGRFKTIYGSFKLLPGDLYFWEFKIVRGIHFIVGVAKYQDIMKNNQTFTNFEGGFGYYSEGSLLSNDTEMKDIEVCRKYGTEYSTGDIIGVCLDSNKGVLSFYLNGKNQGPAFVMQKLKDDIYIPAVSILIDGETIEILH